MNEINTKANALVTFSLRYDMVCSSSSDVIIINVILFILCFCMV